MAKKHPPVRSPSPAPDSQRRLVVWGERRADPDWDRFLAALIALALRRVEADEEDPKAPSE